MLRGLVVALLLCNLVVLGWTQGWLADVLGYSPTPEREPQRLAQQVAPDSLTLLSPQAISRMTPAPVCLEAGPFTPGELAAAEAALRSALPEGGWVMLSREKPGSWMVYAGRYAKSDVMQRRADELRKRQVAFEEVRNLPDYEPGFSFGRYGSLADAQAQVQRLAAQKVRAVRVVRLVPPSVNHTLRVVRASAEQQASLAQLKGTAAMAGHAFTGCGRDVGN